MDSNQNAAFIASFTLLGHVAIKVIMNRQKNYELKVDEASQLRKELKERCDKLQIESDSLKSKYYSEIMNMQREIFNLQSNYTGLKIQLEDIISRGWIPVDQQARYKI